MATVPFTGDVLDVLRTQSMDMLDLDGLADLLDDWQAVGTGKGYLLDIDPLLGPPSCHLPQNAGDPQFYTGTNVADLLPEAIFPPSPP